MSNLPEAIEALRPWATPDTWSFAPGLRRVQAVLAAYDATAGETGTPDADQIRVFLLGAYSHQLAIFRNFMHAVLGAIPQGMPAVVAVAADFTDGCEMFDNDTMELLNVAVAAGSEGTTPAADRVWRCAADPLLVFPCTPAEPHNPVDCHWVSTAEANAEVVARLGEVVGRDIDHDPIPVAAGSEGTTREPAWRCEAIALGLPAMACDPDRPHGAPCGWVPAAEGDKT